MYELEWYRNGERTSEYRKHIETIKERAKVHWPGCHFVPTGTMNEWLVKKGSNSDANSEVLACIFYRSV
jgi:hypothetical protein